MDYKEYQRLIALGFLPGLRDTDPSQYQYKALDNLAKEHTDLRVPITLNVSSNNIITNVTVAEWQAKRTLVPFAIRFSDLDADYIMNYKSGYYLYSIFTSSFRRDFKISVQNSLVVQNVKDTYYPETFVFNVGEGTTDGDTTIYKVTTDLDVIKSCIAAANARKGNQRIVVITLEGYTIELPVVYVRSTYLQAIVSIADESMILSLSTNEGESSLISQNGIIDLSDYYTKEETNTKLSGYVLKENIKDLAPADEEDLTLYTKADSSKVIRLKDRDTTNGMGYKILRLPEDKILTQDMINEANTIYEIRYDFDLNGATITVPEGCTLKFEGGSLKNGTLVGANTIVSSVCVYKIFGSDIILESFRQTEAYPEWFGGESYNTQLDNGVFINKCLTYFNNCTLTRGMYYIATQVSVNPGNVFKGISSVLGYNINDLSDKIGIIFNGGTPIDSLIMVGGQADIHNMYVVSDSQNVGIKISGSRVSISNVNIIRATTGLITSCYLSKFTRVCSALCNIGFKIQGNYSGEEISSDNTSITMENCYAVECRDAGYVLSNLTYSNLISCACDQTGITGYSSESFIAAYVLKNCKCVNLTGCGSERNLKLLQLEYVQTSRIELWYLGSYQELTAIAPDIYKEYINIKFLTRSYLSVYGDISGVSEYAQMIQFYDYERDNFNVISCFRENIKFTSSGDISRVNHIIENNTLLVAGMKDSLLRSSASSLTDAQTVNVTGESNKFYSGSSLTTLTMTAAKTDNSQHGAEEVFQFSTGTTAPTITITGVSWANGDTPSFTASKTYEIHIMYNSTLDKFLATYATYD